MMLLFATSSTQHLADKMPFPRGKYVIKQFSDQEIYLRIEEDVKGKKVALLASTFSPAENILELFFLLDTLKNGGAKIYLFMPYFGYARQDQISLGEAFTGKCMAEWLSSYELKHIDILHMHSNRLKHFFSYQNILPLELVSSIAQKFDLLIAPDKGAIDFVEKVKKKTNSPMAVMHKSRPKHEKVKISFSDGDVKGKKVCIIEDMICTGSTIIEASKMLFKQGAKEVCVIATHGIFSNDALKKLEKSAIKTIYVTNSIPQKKKIAKLKILDISPLLQKEIKKIF